jgi:hypothetical protein
MFSPVERQVIFLSKETPIVSVGLRTAEVSYTNQNKTREIGGRTLNCWGTLHESKQNGVKIEVGQMIG